MHLFIVVGVIIAPFSRTNCELLQNTLAERTKAVFLQA